MRGLFIWAVSDRTRENGFELKDLSFGLDISKQFFTVRVVGHSKKLPRKR